MDATDCWADLGLQELLVDLEADLQSSTLMNRGGGGGGGGSGGGGDGEARQRRMHGHVDVTELLDGADSPTFPPLQLTAGPAAGDEYESEFHPFRARARRRGAGGVGGPAYMDAMKHRYGAEPTKRRKFKVCGQREGEGRGREGRMRGGR